MRIESQQQKYGNFLSDIKYLLTIHYHEFCRKKACGILPAWPAGFLHKKFRYAVKKFHIAGYTGL
jgi:hypothetical protein